jgi:exoribonuclease-2
MAIYGTDASEYKRGKQLLDRAGLTGGQTRPFEILVKLGEMGVHENLDLSREGVSVSFSSEALAEADDLAKASAPGSGRRDLSHLDLITVDSGGARDFDDAVSLEPIEAGFRLGVHIADVSSVIHPDTVLDLEARYRATSIYMPDRRIPMLPEILSEERLSLKEGEPRPAFSMTADLSPDGEVLDYTFFSSLVRVNRQLSYQEVDAGYQNDLVLSRMFDLSEALKRRRTETGALLLPLPKLNVYLTPDGEIGVNLTDWENPGRSMIGEFMILANYLAARLLTERGAPCYYRHQPSPSQVLIDGQTDRSNLYLCLQQRQFLQRVDWGLKPKAHAGMGLDVYTNLTSPLRRYIDLVIQRQVRSVVDSGEPLYSAEDLSELLTTTEAARRKAFRVQNRRRRYWLMRYFEQMPERTFQALVLNKLPHRWRLFIPEFMLDIDLPDKPPLKLEPGQKIDVRIKKVDAREEIFRFVPV